MSGLYFTQQPQDAVVVKGNPAQLNCSATTEGGHAVNITWQRDGEPLENTRNRYVLLGGALYFKKITHRKQRGSSERSTGKIERTDAGVYVCYAKDPNNGGIVASRKAKLTIASEYLFCQLFGDGYSGKKQANFWP